MSDPSLIAYLEIASERVSHHGRLLWEEEKHYTWWVYVLFGALSIVLTTQVLNHFWRLLLVIVVSVYGVIVSWLGLRVIRREGEQMHEALQAQEEILDTLKIPYKKRAKANPNKTLTQLRTSLIKTILRRTLSEDQALGIRDCFQVTLIAAIVLFIVFDLVSVAILAP